MTPTKKERQEDPSPPFVMLPVSHAHSALIRQHIEPLIEEATRVLREGLASKNEHIRVLAAHAVFSLCREPEKEDETLP